ncbi:MAG: Uma2 family endonuclease [Chloroflexota bacterium]
MLSPATVSERRPRTRPISFNGFPPLESGDRLSRAEFEQRYEARPDIKKAELIEGVVYVSSPVHFQKHGWPHGRVITWLGTYEAATPGVYLADNVTLRLGPKSVPQPDAMLIIDPKLGGRSRISGDDYLEGSPELIIEVAASTASYDMHDKLRVYQRNSVQEYLVLLVYERRAIWHVLEDNKYRVLLPDDRGLLRSQVFPGSVLAPQLFWADDQAGVLAVLQREGLASPEHAAFVTQLSTKQ